MDCSWPLLREMQIDRSYSQSLQGLQNSSLQPWFWLKMSTRRDNVGRGLSEFWVRKISVPTVSDPPGLNEFCPAGLLAKRCSKPLRSWVPSLSSGWTELENVAILEASHTYTKTPTIFILSQARQVERVVNTSTAQITPQCSNAFHSMSVAIQYWFYLEQKESFDDRI